MPMPTLLAVGSTLQDAQALVAALQLAREAGATSGLGGHISATVQAADCITLVQQVANAAPQQVIAYLPRGVADLLPALAAWQGQPPCPLSVVLPGLQPAHAEALAAGGVAAWCDSLEPAALRATLAFAWARYSREQAREQTLRQELAAVRIQIDERKWVDRAKGLLMAARSIAEDEAFKLLRGAAMHANLKLAEVSRAVIDAARWAEAVNRAGQLRMLSQRVVALAAQSLLRVDATRAGQMRKQAQQRAQANIVFLESLGLEGEAALAFAAVRAQGEALDAALAVRNPSAPPATRAARATRATRAEPAALAALAYSDERAEALLQAADHLTDVLEAHGARRALAVVNLCGSQRMRAQRLAKEALLATLLPDAGRALRLQALVAEFEAVQRRIENTPLSSPEIRAALSAAQEGWWLLLRASRAGEPLALVQANESLLQHLDLLTDSCEHSLQVLMA